jgi:hypothetical protein
MFLSESHSGRRRRRPSGRRSAQKDLDIRGVQVLLRCSWRYFDHTHIADQFRWRKPCRCAPAPRVLSVNFLGTVISACRPAPRHPRPMPPIGRPRRWTGFVTRRKGLFARKRPVLWQFPLQRPGRVGIVENMATYGNSSEKDKLRPFYADLLEDGLEIDSSEEAEGSDEGFDKKKKKDNCWHSFKSP